MIIGGNNFQGLSPTLLFIVAPCLMIFLVYTLPEYSAIWVFICFVLLIMFIVHLYNDKKENFLLVAAIVPNTVGPFLSGFIFELHNIPTSPEGDLLVGYSFHIAAVLALVLYVLLNVAQTTILKVCLVGMGLLIGIIALSSPNTVWYPGPELFYDVEAPSISPLFVGRVLLTVLCAFVALNHFDEKKNTL